MHKVDVMFFIDLCPGSFEKHVKIDEFIWFIRRNRDFFYFFGFLLENDVDADESLYGFLKRGKSLSREQEMHNGW